MSGKFDGSMTLSRRSFLAVAGAGAAARGVARSAPPMPTIPSSTSSPWRTSRRCSAMATCTARSSTMASSCRPSLSRRWTRASCARSCRTRPAKSRAPSSSIPDHFLYLVREGGQAIRYGVGIGRAGFAWSGRAVIQWKQKWPSWTPPDEMVARQPELVQFSAANGGMPPRPQESARRPRALLFQDGEDTLYRLHGSPEWRSIGKSVSSGCVRLINQDVIDLYDRVPTRRRSCVTSGMPMPRRCTCPTVGPAPLSDQPVPAPSKSLFQAP